jgi:hypothetical protein
MINPVTRHELIDLIKSTGADGLWLADGKNHDFADPRSTELLDQAADRLNVAFAGLAHLHEAERAREKVLRDYIHGGDISGKTAVARLWIVTAGLQ